uniref:Uncharacterized protein n=1 Tax=Caenorhabditis japonica TaxID=281687 RepID=A0A8R1IW34_CAEJA
MRLFVADFEASMSKRFDIKFWSKLKNLMDEMRKATENDRLVDVNTQNLAVGFLTDLSLLCHYHYEIPEFGMPRHLTWTPTVCHTRKRVESVKNCRVFAAYIMLRMGDLMRYKNYLDIAKTYYELSARLNPADGATWNQLGVSATLR